jgi:hypothetical protein
MFVGYISVLAHPGKEQTLKRQSFYPIKVLTHLGNMFVGEHRLELHGDELLDLVGLKAAE